MIQQGIDVDLPTDRPDQRAIDAVRAENHWQRQGVES